MTVKPVADDIMLNVQALSKKKVVKDFPACEVKPGPDSGSADSPIQYKYKCTGTYCLVDTVGYGAKQQTFHSCASADQVSSRITPSLGPGTLRLDLRHL